MILYQNAAVNPPRFEDKELRKAIGEAIGQAGYDDLLAAFLWVHEGHLARSIRQQLSEHYETVKRERDHAEKRAEGYGWADVPSTLAYCDIAQETYDHLGEELSRAEQMLQQATTAWREMSEDYGRIEELRQRYDRREKTEPSPLEALAELPRQCLRSQQRVKEILAEDRNQTHALALREARLTAFRQSPASVSRKRIDAMHHTEFERTVAALARRDGFRLVRAHGGTGDLGADVIAVAPDGQTRVVIQCKHTRRGATKVGSPALQQLNGTARQVHQADVVVAVTNGRFSWPATRFAYAQNIHTIDWMDLEHWATWGVPLAEILDLKALSNSNNADQDCYGGGGAMGQVDQQIDAPATA
ncbi:restriction endonuclease [Streptomyces sp. 4N509B]|uniref:restriction endonuclease n=1 Tax=Streptomyces sp. 4N509B TaxID=3457413 RepID=UPI003FCF6E79